MSIIVRRRWWLAARGLCRLARNNGDLHAVMDIVQGLEGRSIWRAYRRMQHSPTGRPLMLELAELPPLLMDDAWLASFSPGTLGAAYRAFVTKRALSASTMAAHMISGPNRAALIKRGPVSWFARRIADMHDIAHVLTGYDATPRGEGCLMGWTFAQLHSLGYLAIAVGSATIFGPGPIIEAYRNGRRASWVFDLNVVEAFAKPLSEVRHSLGIVAPTRYYGASRGHSFGQHHRPGDDDAWNRESYNAA